MRKGRDGENGMEWKIMVKIVATTSLPVDRLTATDCNAAARAKKLRNFGHMFKLGLSYLPSTLVWTKISFDICSYCLPYLPIQKVWTVSN